MKLVIVRNSIVVLSILLSASNVRAEIYQCDGKWTNKPCDGTIERTMQEKVDPSAGLPGFEETRGEQGGEQAGASEAPSEPLAPRYSIARKIKKLSKDFAEKHGVSLSKEELRSFEERCTRRETPFSQCQSEFDMLSQKLAVMAEQNKKH